MLTTSLGKHSVVDAPNVPTAKYSILMVSASMASTNVLKTYVRWLPLSKSNRHFTLFQLFCLLFTTTVAVCIKTTILFDVTVLVTILDVFGCCACSLCPMLSALSLFFESLLLSLLVFCLELFSSLSQMLV